MANPPPITPGDHVSYMRHALSLAKKAPARRTNFRVGAILVDEDTNTVLSTGYTMELPGNTHAEECCLAKAPDGSGAATQTQKKKLALYTTMEPCDKRASGNTPCTETILKKGGGIRVVYVGVREPETFVGENVGRARLEEAGVGYVHVAGLEAEILEVATAGHEKS